MKKALLAATALVAVLVAGQAIATSPTVGAQRRNQMNQSNRDMRQAMKLIHEAHQLLAQALPVYDWKRIDAMEAIHAANKELHDALEGVTAEPAPQLDRNGKPIKKKRPYDGDHRSKYSPDQIAASDQKLRDADGRIGDAIAKLDNADPLYHGERADAITKLRNGQDLIKAALAIR